MSPVAAALVAPAAAVGCDWKQQMDLLSDSELAPRTEKQAQKTGEKLREKLFLFTLLVGFLPRQGFRKIVNFLSLVLGRFGSLGKVN